MRTIDLNVDIGEGFEFDSELLLYASSANICCGAHAGSWKLTQETVGMALDSGVRIGMHPGYPNRENMGRLSVRPDQQAEYADSLESQVDNFFNFVPAAYLKPHGAFYADSQDGLHPMANVLMRLCEHYRMPVMGMPGTAHEGLGAGFIPEGFADRGYTVAGRLIPRGSQGAILDDFAEIRRQAARLAGEVDTICIHGDTPGCLEIARRLVEALLEEGIEVGS